MLEDKNIDAVLVATPLSAHYKIVMDAFDAGNMYSAKSQSVIRWKSVTIYIKASQHRKIFFTGQQRLFDPLYQGDEMIQRVRSANQRNSCSGTGMATETFCSFTKFERLINWRLYKEFSKGLMTELACHQLQIGSWALQNFLRR